MFRSIFSSLAFPLCLCLLFSALSDPAHAGRRRYPKTTHPIILWSKTLSESVDIEQRRVAAFKLSQYTQPIAVRSIVVTLIQCSKDKDVQVKVFCTKALGNVSKKMAPTVRRALLERFDADPMLRNTITRTFIERKETDPSVQNKLFETLLTAEKKDGLLVLLSYFERFGNGEDAFIRSLLKLYSRYPDPTVRRSIAKVLAERAKGQASVVRLFAKCSLDPHTPLALICLSGLETQAGKDVRAWKAIEKTIQSDDPDVVIAALDVIHALPETPNAKISKRLIELVSEAEDPDLQEKAILGLGIVGDKSQSVVGALLLQLRDSNASDNSKIAAALVLGKQASNGPQYLDAKTRLSSCAKAKGSKGFMVACQIGLRELKGPTKK